MAKLLERVLKWLLPVLIAVEIVLVWTGWLDLGTAIGVTVAIEVLLVVVAGRQLFVAVRRYHRQRTAGLDVWAALEDGLTVLLPRPVARIVSLEPRMIACLLLWLFRRGRQGAGQFSYHRRSWGGALLILVLLTVPVEIFVVELLVPWAWLRWVLLIAALYGVLWIGGLIASLKVLPHQLEAGGVRLRHGNLAEVLIPYHEIADVEQQSLRAPGPRPTQTHPTGDDGACGSGRPRIPRRRAATSDMSGPLPGPLLVGEGVATGGPSPPLYRSAMERGPGGEDQFPPALWHDGRA